MDNQVHNQIVSFIWGIADDCLRDVYVRGKYRQTRFFYIGHVRLGEKWVGSLGDFKRDAFFA